MSIMHPFALGHRNLSKLLVYLKQLSNKRGITMKIRAVCEYDIEVDAWSIFCPEVPGLTSCGDTEQKALENFKDAISVYFTAENDTFPTAAKIIEMVI